MKGLSKILVDRDNSVGDHWEKVVEGSARGYGGI